MAADRTVTAFNERADRYEDGWLGRWHAEIATRTAEIAVAAMPSAQVILDVGCGTGQLLRLLATRFPAARQFIGLDPAAQMIAVAQRRARDARLHFHLASAEALPLASQTVDLVVSTTSFDHWRDQRAGLEECHRVLGNVGCLVVADLMSPTLWLTTVIGRRGRARTPRQVQRELAHAGFRTSDQHTVGTMIRAITAVPAR